MNFPVNNFNDETAYNWDIAHPRRRNRKINRLNLLIGSHYRFDRELHLPLSVTDVYDTVASLVFTIKFDNRDGDSDAVLVKSLTYLSTMPDTEYIRYYGGSQLVNTRFALTSADTSLLQEGYCYFYQIKYVTVSGETYISETGILFASN